MGAPLKVDVLLGGLDPGCPSAELKAGQRLALHMPDDGGELLDAAAPCGAVVGSVPLAELARAGFHWTPGCGVVATVRSVFRPKGEGQGMKVQVRLTEGGGTARGEAAGAPAAGEEDQEGSWALKQPQLEALAASDDLRQVLRDKRLQEVIRRVDGANDARKELLSTMESDPAFVRFCDQVLATLSTEEQELSMH